MGEARNWRYEAWLFRQWIPLIFNLTKYEACFKLGYMLGTPHPNGERVRMRVTDGVNIVAVKVKCDA